MTIVEFSGGAARHPRRSKNRKLREKAAERAATVTRIHATIGQFLEATFPPRDDASTDKQTPIDGHICTEAEATALDFSPIREFVMHNGHAGTDEFATATQKWLQNINVVARFSMVLCGKPKNEVMELVRSTLKPSSDNPEITEAEEFYAMLEEGCKDAERLVRMIRAAQIRQLVAMSSVSAEMNSSVVQS